MAGRVEGKVAIVTGGARGIGRGMAEALVAQGAKVLIADISGEEATTAKEIGGDTISFNLDVSDGAGVRDMVGLAVSTFGRLDVMCANAGLDGEFQASGEATEENFDRVVAVNLRGAFLCNRHAIPAMLESGGGSIIHTASIAGLVAFPTMAAYGAAKAGVIHLCRVAAHEYGAAGIRVNAICPGVIETPMLRTMPAEVQQQVEAIATSKTAIPHLGTVADIASAAVYLASDESGFITGTEFKVDGGWCAA